MTAASREANETGSHSVLRNLVRREEERILASFAGERRLGLVELARAMDTYCLYVLGLGGEGEKHEAASGRHDL